MSASRLHYRRGLVAVVAAIALSSLTPVGAGAVTNPPRTVAFAGSTWALKASTGLVGPGPNVFSDSPQNVWVDGSGQLHLRITHRDGGWQSAEVILDRSLGYGTYHFDVATPIGRLDPNVVLGLFTWNDSPTYNHREIDIEFARWGSTATSDNAQYVVQPSDHSGNVTRFVQPDNAASSHEFTWASNLVAFSSTAAGGLPIASRRYKGADIPKAGGEHTRINLWLAGGAPPTDSQEVEVVLSGFSFTRR